MDVGAVLAVSLAFVFAFTNGFHDAANSIATIVVTRAARPASALALAVFVVFLGPLLLGSAVAATVAGIVHVPRTEMTEVVVSALAAALAWNLFTWYRGLPSSSSHALVGGLVGAALAAGGLDAVAWGGGFGGTQTTGVIAVLAGLALTPVIAAAAALVVLRLLRLALRRATTRFARPVLGAQWPTSALLGLSAGANDGQKSIGLVAAVLLATGSTSSSAAPTWATFGIAAALASGAALGGWRIARTIGHRIYPVRPLDALASQAASAIVMLAASVVGAPVSASHVVASSIVGIGGGRRRWGRVRWAVVREIGVAWLTTIPATAALAAIGLLLWRRLS